MKIFLYTTLYFLLSTTLVGAAQLYFEPASVKLGVSESARIEFLLDSPESVNAVEGAIAYPADLLEIKNINDGSSIINFWIFRPEAKDGKITFVGVIPGGYPAFRGKIFSIELVAKKSGSGTLAIGDAQALLNDGQGTPAQLTLRKLAVSVGAKATGAIAPEIQDDTPPEDFRPAITNDPNVFDGKNILIFATQDKGAGIAYYEVAEEKGFFQPKPELWEKAKSPHLLKDQELKSWVFVRAVDLKGNQKVAVISPMNRPFYAQPLTIGIIIIVVLILIVNRRLWTRYLKLKLKRR